MNERRFQHVANLIEEKQVVREKKSTDLKNKNIIDPTQTFLAAIMGVAIKEVELELEKDEKDDEQIQIIGTEEEVSKITGEKKQKRLDKLKQTALEHITAIDESVKRAGDHTKEAKLIVEKIRQTPETNEELLLYTNIIEKYYNKIVLTRKQMVEFYQRVLDLKNKVDVGLREKNVKKLRRYNKKLEHIQQVFTEEPTLIGRPGQQPIQLRRMGYVGFEYVIKDNSILINKMNEQIAIRKKQIELDKTATEPQIQESQKKAELDAKKQVEPQIRDSQKKTGSDFKNPTLKNLKMKIGISKN